MKISEDFNEYGTPRSLHICDTCKVEFSLTPAVKDGVKGWENCTAVECASYDPHRDIELLFMSNQEIARDKKVVSLDLLRKRKLSERSDD